MITPSVAFDFINRQVKQFNPKIAVVLGSGNSAFAQKLQNVVAIPYQDIPGFTTSSVPGHESTLLLGYLHETPLVCLQGRAHYYENTHHLNLQIPIRVLKLLGCETLILTNAAASLQEEVTPGSLVIINDHINFQFQNPLVGENDDAFGPRFPSLQNAYDKRLIDLAFNAACELGIPITTGVYLATLGPSYETPAEIRAFKIWGADLVGMSTVPEVIIARHCELSVLAISTITNMACGMTEETLTHANVLNIAQTASGDLGNLLVRIIRTLHLNRDAAIF